MRLFDSFRADRTLRRRSARYADALFEEPADEDVTWLATAATRGDADHARWELRYLRRALGILVAERDALDDRTASESLRALLHRMDRDPHVAPELRELAERQFDARLSAYRDAFTRRSGGAPAVRVAQNLLAFAGGPIRAEEPAVQRGAALIGAYTAVLHAALQETFGAANLPEDVPPSALGSVRGSR